MPGRRPGTGHRWEEYAVGNAQCREVGMERERKQRRRAFFRFEIEALRELPGKLSWMGWLWLFVELLVVILVVMSCLGF